MQNPPSHERNRLNLESVGRENSENSIMPTIRSDSTIFFILLSWKYCRTQSGDFKLTPKRNKNCQEIRNSLTMFDKRELKSWNIFLILFFCSPFYYSIELHKTKLDARLQNHNINNTEHNWTFSDILYARKLLDIVNRDCVGGWTTLFKPNNNLVEPKKKKIWKYFLFSRLLEGISHIIIAKCNKISNFMLSWATSS